MVGDTVDNSYQKASTAYVDARTIRLLVRNTDRTDLRLTKPLNDLFNDIPDDSPARTHDDICPEYTLIKDQDEVSSGELWSGLK